MKKTTTPPVTKPTTTTPPAAKPSAAASVRPPLNTKTVRPSATKEKITSHLFDKENYKWMLAGLIVIAIGFVVMAGGKSSNPNVFEDKDVYSFTRITVAPVLIIAGFIIEIVAIMRKPADRTAV